MRSAEMGGPQAPPALVTVGGPHPQAIDRSVRADANDPKPDIGVGPRPAGTARRRSRRLVYLHIPVAFSVLWTVYAILFRQVSIDVRTSWILASIFALSELIFTISAVVILLVVGRTIQATRARSLLAGTRSLRATFGDTFHLVGSNKTVVAAFYINWVAALTTGLAGLVAVVVLLPFQGWGLAAYPVLDLFASVAWRLPISRRIGAQSATVPSDA